MVAENGTVIDDQFNGENTAQCDPTNFPAVQCVDIVVQPGGNIIGNPYLAVKDLLQASDVRVCNSTASAGCANATDWKTFPEAVTSGWLLNAIHYYNPGTQLYDYAQSIADGAMRLGPWEGWWLRVDTMDTIVLRFYR